MIMNLKMYKIVFCPGGASIARGMSLYIDSLTNKTMETAFRALYEIDLPYLSEYFDFFAMFIVLVFSGNNNLLYLYIYIVPILTSGFIIN